MKWYGPVNQVARVVGRTRGKAWGVPGMRSVGLVGEGGRVAGATVTNPHNGEYVGSVINVIRQAMLSSKWRR